MPRGGKRNGAGRKAGSHARVKGKPESKIILRGLEVVLTPLAVMLEAMRHYHEAGNREKAAAIAKDAAPYVHPRLSAMAVNVNGEAPTRLAIVEEIVVQGALPDNGNGCDAHANGEAAPGAAGVPQE